MADKNKVIQLLDPETGDKVSPVVNVGSIYDKKGQKIDNLLSYKVSGMDATIPEVKNIVDDVKNSSHRIGDIVQNIIGPPDSSWIPCDGRIIDTEFSDLTSMVTIPSLTDLDDPTKWNPVSNQIFASRNVYNASDSSQMDIDLYELGLTGDFRVVNFGDIICIVSDNRHVEGSQMLKISFDSGKTFRTYNLNMEISDKIFTEFTLYRIKDSIIIIWCDNVGNAATTIYCKCAIVSNSTKNESDVAWKTLTSRGTSTGYTNRYNVDFTLSTESKLFVCIEDINIRSSSQTYSLHSIDVTNNIVTTNMSGISTVRKWSSASSYQSVIATAYDSATSTYVLVASNSTPTVIVYTSKDMKTFTNVMTLSGNDYLSNHKAYVTFAYNNKFSYVTTFTNTSYLYVVIMSFDITNKTYSIRVVYSTTTKTYKPTPIGPKIILIESSEAFVFDNVSGTYRIVPFPTFLYEQMSSISTDSCYVDDKLYVSSYTYGTFVFDMKNKRIPYIPGSYIKVR